MVVKCEAQSFRTGKHVKKRKINVQSGATFVVLIVIVGIRDLGEILGSEVRVVIMFVAIAIIFSVQACCACVFLWGYCNL